MNDSYLNNPAKAFGDYIESEARLSQEYKRIEKYDQTVGLINSISTVIFIVLSIILLIKKIKHKKIQKALIIFWIISILAKIVSIILAHIVH